MNIEDKRSTKVLVNISEISKGETFTLGTTSPAIEVYMVIADNKYVRLLTGQVFNIDQVKSLSLVRISTTITINSEY